MESGDWDADGCWVCDHGTSISVQWMSMVACSGRQGLCKDQRSMGTAFALHLYSMMSSKQ